MGRGQKQGRYLAVDLGGTNVRVALADSDAVLIARLQQPTALALGPSGIVEQMASMSEHLLADADLPLMAICGLGVAVPGPIDEPRGAVLGPPNLPGWDEVFLGAMLRARLGIDAVLANDANAAALGEWAFGAGKGTGTMVYLTVSTGIGGGVIADGRLLRGRDGDAVEIGHMCIDPHGPRCGCGSPGCLEAFASGTSIARRFQELIGSGEESRLVAELGGRPVTAADVARAALGGDALALSVMLWASEALGVGVANCVNIFNPETVVLGGGVTQVGALLFETVRAVVNRFALPALSRGVRIVPSALQDDAGLVGAAVLARESSALS